MRQNTITYTLFKLKLIDVVFPTQEPVNNNIENYILE